MVDQPCTHCISFRCAQCDTNARSSSLWWTNLAPTVLQFGVAKMIQMLDPFFVVAQPCTHCISFRCGQCDTDARSCSLCWTNLAPTAFHFGVENCDTNARSNSLWSFNLAPTAFHFGVANVIQMLDPILCGGSTLHPQYFISV